MAFLVILGILCRGFWSVEQNAHATAPTLGDAEHGHGHGHGHGGILDHHHAPEAQLSDMVHMLLHGFGGIDSQLLPGSVEASTSLVRSPWFAPSKSNLLEPLSSQLFRPPRSGLAAESA
jgi:hypothetical protein